MYKIEIASDTAEGLFKDILIQDYFGLKMDESKLMAKKNDSTILPYETEDLEHTIRYINAIEIMMEYYIYDWRNTIYKDRKEQDEQI